MKKWFVKNNRLDYMEYAQNANIHPLIAKLLINRNIEEKDAQSFLKPTFENSCHDPFLMKGMKEGCDLILDAIENNKHIRIIGDYDQDGNSATMTLMDGLMIYTENLSYAIPHRVEDGYGISISMVEQAKKDDVDLLITCDNGISAFEAVKKAKELGLTIIVTDHHQVVIEDGKEIIPDADVVINPQQKDCNYPFKKLCGAGVAFKVIQGLYSLIDGDEEYLLDLLEYVAMGTVCDIVDLVDENRYFVVEGLRRLNETENYGIQSLVRECGISTKISAYTLGFIIGPCINASGRLDTATKGVELFLEENMDNIDAYAKELVALNKERKEMTENGFGRLVESIEEEGLSMDRVLVVKDEEIHESIAGIIAGRIKERYNRPTIVFTKAKEEGILKGSGRSIEEYNMYEAINPHRDMMVGFGGHPMAAGMSIKNDNFMEFRSILNKECDLTDDDLIPKLYLDSTLKIDKVDFDLIEMINMLEPYGKANTKPIFGDKGLGINKLSVIGKNQNVLKIEFISGNQLIDGILFDDIDSKLEYLAGKFGKEELNLALLGQKNKLVVDIAFVPDINTFRGISKIQLIIKDIR